MRLLYVLDEQGNPMGEDNIDVWSSWFINADGTVAIDEVSGVLISTMFLGVDHSSGNGKPLLFETMIFGGVHDGYMDRYTMRDEALIGHVRAVKLVTG